MPDRVVLDTGVIFAIYFKEEASSQAKRAAVENDPITVDLAFEISVEDKTTFYDPLFLKAAEKEQVPLLTLDKKLYEKVKVNRDVQMV